MKTPFTLVLLASFFVGSLFLIGCEKEDLPPEDYNLVRCDIPEGVTPIEFGSKAEAVQFIRSLQQRPPIEVYANEEIDKMSVDFSLPLIKTRQEYGGSGTLHPGGWWFQSLAVDLFYDYVGGPVRINSYMVGFTFGVGWTQTSYSYSWRYPDSSTAIINYTVRGTEEYYVFVEGIGHVYSRPIEVNGSYTVPK